MDKELDNPIENTTEEKIGDDIDKEEEKIEEDLEKNLEESSIKKYKKIIIPIMIFLCTLIIIYFGMVKYFMNHFYFGTKINGIDVSGQTVEEVKVVMSSQLKSYTLKLKERGGNIEEIKAKDIGLEYSSDKEFEKFKDNQNPFKWVLECFNGKDSKEIVEVSYDEKLLKEQIDELSFFNSNNVIEPQNATLKYVDNKYEIVDEVLGTKVDKDILYSHVADSIVSGETEIDLESIDCYVKPKYTSNSKKVVETKKTLDRYVSSKIIYTFEEGKEVLDGSIINKWLKVDKNFKVKIDEEKVKEYVNVLSENYDTIGKTRNFVTSSGKTIRIGGGDYGWYINKTKETENLISAIEDGNTITRDPEYSQTAFVHGKNDIGNTYVEIDLTNQHIWYYKNGSLIAQGDIVTGNISQNHTTPPGIYRLKYKVKDVILRGDDYASPVTFWMPFNGGIGIHDATWRSQFGGQIYKTNGSHGCINCPYDVAKAIYNNIVPETPVICY
ncbi:L,D-transpeptidase/peptidoglycan binding protein [Clostridium sp. D2Q-14]|uniref:L,D-transpeptidase family protein n=1 Tax=Anaeromonas gelatinilytica TaxID=2683194 RepID=UPI00193B8A6A|nr:L,D-transpeptidase/peptidoglycan binding protein [Anaeromonas gelatinilytica]MBS4536290.1 L,D-transpeptidase/peptidoglycan binding protein [Anaeromonas gelatinilytica]